MRRVVVWTLATFLIVVPVTIGVLFAVVANGLAHIGERHHLSPIAIEQSACPYVAAMHAAANDFQAAVPFGGPLVGAQWNAVPWPQTRARIDGTLATLELSILVGEPHFPVRIRQQLAVTLQATREGRAQLARTTDSSTVFAQTSAVLDRGKQAFGYASDLVGHQCAVPLGADSATLFTPASAAS